MTVAAIIQARMGSTRLPGKVLADLHGRPVLGWVVRAAGEIAGVERVVVATGTGAEDGAIAGWCAAEGIVCTRGPTDDVLQRYAEAAKAGGARIVLRLTADAPFLDPDVCAQVLYLLETAGADYACNTDPPRWPDGLDCEAFTSNALFAAAAEATRPTDREHVTPFLLRNRHRFVVRSLSCPIPGLARERWTVDTAEDLAFARRLAPHLPAERAPRYIEVLRALDADPDLRAVNAGIIRNEGYRRTRAAEHAAGPRPRPSFAHSQRLLERTERIIPLASQTFSKSRVQFPTGAAPLFVTHGEGGRLYDVDGNEYVDMVGGLLCVTLGYRDPDVDVAITTQLAEGISFSVASERERQLAERLVEIIPCAEMVRFGKSGSDATSAAVRLARAATGRDHVIACGYHGWHDWYIGATARSKGVPKALRALTHMVPYNDLEAVRRVFRDHPGEVAVLIMEPMNVEEPAPGYLEELRELVHAGGALLVFDEIITGFRFSLGGAQELFGVTPDLAAFGKGMANGMPISAVVGRANLMAEMEEIFFSSTFGGEALSLAAAIATIDKMRREPVIETLWSHGSELAEQVGGLVSRHGLVETIRLNGKAPWTVLGIMDHDNGSAQAIKTMLIYELAAHGVLSLGSHNVCYAHTAADLAETADAYDAALSTIRAALDGGRLEDRLAVPALEPVFRVR